MIKFFAQVFTRMYSYCRDTVFTNDLFYYLHVDRPREFSDHSKHARHWWLLGSGSFTALNNHIDSESGFRS